jgi:hypothetical protein
MTTQEFETLVSKLYTRWDVDGDDPQPVPGTDILQFQSYPYMPVQVDLRLHEQTGELDWTVGRLDGGEIKHKNALVTLLTCIESATDWDPRKRYTVLHKYLEKDYKQYVWVSTDDLNMAKECFDDCLSFSTSEVVKLIEEGEKGKAVALSIFRDKHLYTEAELAEYNKPKPLTQSVGPTKTLGPASTGSWAAQKAVPISPPLASKQPTEQNNCPNCKPWACPGWILGKTGWEQCPKCNQSETAAAEPENDCQWCGVFSVPGFTGDGNKVEACKVCNPNNCRSLAIPTIEQVCGWDDEDTPSTVIDMNKWDENSADND